MTSEELAVVQAAMAYRYKLLANPRALDVLTNANNPLTSALSEIARTTHSLAVARGEVKHAGADGSCPDYGSRLDPCPPGCASGTCVASQPAISEEPNLVWAKRTWVDVRTGDHVRMPGSDATAHVQSAVHLRWHVKPGTGTSQYNPPQPLEWAGVRVSLADTPQLGEAGVCRSYEMDPAKPVEIEIDQETFDLLAAGAFDWEDRVGMVIEEKVS